MNLISNVAIPKKDKQKSFANPFKYLVLIFLVTGVCLPVVANDSLDLLKRWKELSNGGKLKCNMPNIGKRAALRATSSKRLEVEGQGPQEEPHGRAHDRQP